MGSSGSTPTPPGELPIRLYVRLVGEDHPRACTGRRLLKLALASERSGGGPAGPRGIVLDPHAPEPLSGADRAFAERGGLTAVDCSWNRVGARGGLPEGTSGRRARRRRLPFLRATNPQHFGRVGELNTAEALAAALWVLGRPAQATAVLAPFAGGAAFFSVNAPELDRYAACADGPSVRAAEQRLF